MIIIVVVIINLSESMQVISSVNSDQFLSRNSTRAQTQVLPIPKVRVDVDEDYVLCQTWWTGCCSLSGTVPRPPTWRPGCQVCPAPPSPRAQEGAATVRSWTSVRFLQALLWSFSRFPPSALGGLSLAFTGSTYCGPVSPLRP